MKKNNNFIYLALLAIVFALPSIYMISSFIHNSTDENISPTISSDGTYIGDSLSSSDLKIQINGYNIDLNLAEFNPTVSVQSLNTEYQNTISYSTNDPEIEVYINQSLVNEEGSFYIEEIGSDTTFSVTIIKGNSQRNITLLTIPNEFPTLQFSGTSPSSGDFYGDILNDQGNSYVYKINNQGDIIFYYGGYHDGLGSVMNFEKHVVNDTTYYSFFKPNLNATEQLLYPGIQYGEIILLNHEYQMIDTINLISTESNQFVENHEFTFIDEGHYILTSALDHHLYLASIGEFARVKSTYIQEVKDGNIIFEWDSINHPEFFLTALTGNNYENPSTSRYAADYMHFNSLTIDPFDNNLIISLRNQDSIIKLDRESGEILWTLGGLSDDFNIDANQYFSRQHYASITEDGTLLLFDNGVATKQTRILEFMLNESTKEIISTQEFLIPGVYASATGSVVKTEEGTYVIGWGAGNSRSLMSEVDPITNEIHCELLSDQGRISYRITKQ